MLFWSVYGADVASAGSTLRRRTLARRALVLAATTGLAAGGSPAAASLWTPTDGGTYSWADGANWDTDPVFPDAAGDVASINNATNAKVRTSANPRDPFDRNSELIVRLPSTQPAEQKPSSELPPCSTTIALL